jgi:hypothetical protein
VIFANFSCCVGVSTDWISVRVRSLLGSTGKRWRYAKLQAV